MKGQISGIMIFIWFHITSAVRGLRYVIYAIAQQNSSDLGDIVKARTFSMIIVWLWAHHVILWALCVKEWKKCFYLIYIFNLL